MESIQEHDNPTLAPVALEVRIPIACPEPAISPAVPDPTQKLIMAVIVTVMETVQVDDVKCFFFKAGLRGKVTRWSWMQRALGLLIGVLFLVLDVQLG